MIEVRRDEIPQDWTEDQRRMLLKGHERGVVSAAKGEKAVSQVLGFASARGVGPSVFAGLTFVDVSANGTNGPVRFELAD